MSDPQKRLAVVTGGQGMIGSAIVETLRDDGLEVVTIDQTGEFVADLQHESEVRRVARDILSSRGTCDVLVHAAAAFDRASLEDLDVDTFRHAVAVNVEAALWLAQEFVPGMKAAGAGRIILLTSDTTANPPPVPSLLPYITTKMALVGVARSLSRSLGPDGITVNCVAVGLTPPPTDSHNMPPGWNADVMSRQALQRNLLPSDTATVVSFLASEGTAAISGQSLYANGGLILT